MDPKRRELLIYGYIREMENNNTLSYEIPDDVKGIIKSNYPLEFKWKPSGNLKISDDGLTVSSNEDQYRTMQFGEFLHKKDNIIFKASFLLIEGSKHRIGVGAITPQYVQPKFQRDYNKGENHTMWIDGAGYFINTPSDFKTKYQNKSTIYEFSNLYDKNAEFYVEANMITQKIKIWSKTDENKVFEIECPESIAVIADLCPNQTLSVTEQIFTYKQG